MSNEIENSLSITGPEASIARAVEICRGKDRNGEDSEFTLHAIVPCPESVNFNAGTVFDIATWAMSPKVTPPQPGWARNFAAWFGRAPAELRAKGTLAEWYAWFREDPEMSALGRVGCDNIRLHGAKDWYDWSILRWGTKWDAYSEGSWERSEGAAVIKFSTANSAPDEALRVLSIMVRDVLITDDWVDEGGEAGTLAYQGGICTRNDSGPWSAFPHGVVYERARQAEWADDHRRAEESMS